MSVFHNNALIGAGAGTGEVAAAEYVIPKSLRFNSGDSSYLSKTPSSAGNRRTWTWSGWVKRAKLGDDEAIFSGGASNPITTIRFSGEGSASPDGINIFHYAGSFSFQLTTTAQYRDLSSWYHIVVALDTTQATASNRLKLYVNGEQVTAFDTETYPSQNFETEISNTSTQTIARNGTGSNYKNGYLADIQFVDGQALAPTDFGETRSSDGVWVPKEFTGTFTDTRTIEVGTPSYPSDFTTTGDKTSDQTSLSFSTWSGSYTGAATKIFKMDDTTAFDLTIDLSGGTNDRYLWTSNNATNWTYVGNVNGLGKPYKLSGSKYYATSEGSGSTTLTAVNPAAGVNSFHLNFSDSSTNEALGFDSAPTTPDPDPKKGFDVITYDGTYARLNVGGLNFEPGLVWIKNRDSGSSAHFLADIVRGGTKVLQSNSTGTENTRSNHILSFNPDGFTLGADGTSNYPSGNSFVAWVWRAGGPAVSNSDGTTTSQVSANTDYGFSIVSYTGTGSAATIGHGLTTAPKWIVARNRDAISNWNVYHSALGATKRVRLDENAASQTSSGFWNDTEPTASVFTVNTDNDVNKSGDEHIAYVWSEVSGFSKFGTYEGASTVTVTTGFKPRWIILKNVDASGSWSIFDSERDSDLEINHRIYSNETSAEGTNIVIGNFTDTGFTLTNQGNTNWNTTGDTFVYAAFADRPGNDWDVNNIVTNEGLTTSKTQFDVVTYTGNGGTNVIGGPVYSDTTDSGFANKQYIFDGVDNQAGYYNGTGTDNTITTAPITINTQLRVYNNFRSDGTYAICLNGTCVAVAGVGTSSANYRWSTVDLSGFTLPLTVTSLGYSNSQNSGNSIAKIEVDGTVLLDGDGGPGLKFKPDFVWYKHRSGGSSHGLFDSVRGVNRYMNSNGTGAEQTVSGVTSFNDSGFTLGSDSGGNGSGTWVAWCWKAGGTAVSNTDGSITSSVSANAQYGFSIVSYTGTGSNATVGHGLNTAPKLVIARTRDRASNWAVYHGSVANMATGYLYLNSTIAFATDASDIWNSIDPTSSVFSIGTAGAVNTSSDDHIAYCFADVPGYQRIGSYTGNGSSTGPVVVTGFKPRFLLIKAAVGYSSGSWIIVDSERSTTNPTDHALFPNSSNIENNLPSFGDRDIAIDFLSNGFQIKNSLDADNKSSVDYIYLAIGDDEIGSDEDCLVDVPNAVTADADATDTTGGYQRGNYATLNPLHNYNSPTYANGNLEVSNTSTGHWKSAQATIGVTSGKWYWESTMSGASQYYTLGVAIASEVTNNYTGSGDAFVYDGRGFKNGPGVSSVSYGATYTSGDTIGVALDLDAGTLVFYKNGVSQGTAFSTGLTDKTLFPQFSVYYTSAVTQIVNFGQMRFKYPMPTGFSSLNTTALPAATIADGSAQFDVKLHTGNGSTQTIDGYEFSPDLVWVKQRNTSRDHRLANTVVGAGKDLRANANNAEITDANGITSFNSDGFSVGSSTGWNQSSGTYVAWCWNAGANSNKTYTVKVVSDSGNKYRFDDFGTSAVTLDLAEGSTYVFDQSDSSNSGHPLRFSTTSDGTHNSGTEYTTGVTTTGTPGSAGAKTTIVVGSGVATLYYYCSSHSGMGGQANTNSTAGASNFDGSIQSTVKANPEAGFSIVTYTGNQTEGATVGHGLNSQPLFVTVKDRSTTKDWYTLVKKASGSGASSFGVGYLSGTNPLDGLDTNLFRTNSFDNTPPTSSVFQLGSDGGGWSNTLNDTNNYVAYCISPVAGYSAVGFYEGNGSSDGVFVHTGFRIAWLMIKETSGSDSWLIWDATRQGDNPQGPYLLAEDGQAEVDTHYIDFLSNGFKYRSGHSAMNQSGADYIYLAFASNPFSANGGLAF